MDNESSDEYLNDIIEQMCKPLKALPFHKVIESLSQKQVIAFDGRNVEHSTVLNKLREAANIACAEVNRNGILRPRPNEVGNDIEPYLKNALIRGGYQATTPKTTSGKQKTTGYPDIELRTEGDKVYYIECKTYNIENIDTTQRSFYLSPAEDFKINHDAVHFIVSFEIYVDGRSGSNNIYKARSWKILDAYNLTLDVKYEFNSDNRRMYDKLLILSESEG